MPIPAQPATYVTRATPNALASNTPEQLDANTPGRNGVTVHNLSTSAANVIVVIVPGGTAVDNTYMQTTGHQDAELAPGDSVDLLVSAGLDVWGVAVGAAATVSVTEYQ